MVKCIRNGTCIRITLAGLIIPGVINNSRTLFGADEYVQYIVRGLMILIPVLINTIQTQKKD